jgi:hypothetical protein
MMSGHLTASLPDQAVSGAEGRRGVRLVARALVTTAAAAAFFSVAGLSASAAPGDTSEATVDANVIVNSTINLALDQASFDINATPDSTEAKTGAVTGTVTTNNATGYSVGVVAEADTLQPTLPDNDDTIPIANLEVRNDAGVYTPVSNDEAAPVITVTQDTRSALDGDDFSDDYQITVPGVNSDTYSVTLNYTATALA